jgi:hypothetical protein
MKSVADRQEPIATRLTHSVISRSPIAALRKVYSITSSARQSKVGGTREAERHAVFEFKYGRVINGREHSAGVWLKQTLKERRVRI